MESEHTMLSQYTDGSYWTRHSDWHLGDAAGKADDVLPALLAVIDDTSPDFFHVADVGAGAGAVLVEVVNRIRASRPHLRVEATAIEPSPQAAEEAQRRHPELRVLRKPLEPSDGPFTALMFIDVLEHLENPWQMLRTAAMNSDYLVIRLPLIESFSTFRHHTYKYQRDTWGHISYFNYHSFVDLALATGWQPLKIDVVAPWELKTPPNPDARHRPIRSLLRRGIVRLDRIMSSYFMTGFYMIGAFKRK